MVARHRTAPGWTQLAMSVRCRRVATRCVGRSLVWTAVGAGQGRLRWASLRLLGAAMARGQSGRYDHERWMRQQVQAEQRRQRAREATQKVTERERKRQDAETGRAAAEQHTSALAARVAVLESVLVSGLDRNSRVDLSAMHRRDELPPLDLGTLGERVPLPLWRNFEPPALGVVSGLFGGKARHEQEVAQARREFERAQHEHLQAEAAREQQVQQVRARHDGMVRAHQAQVAERNARLTAMAAGVGERDRESVQGYLELVLARVPLPEGFPNQVEVAYSPRGEQAVVRFELPTVDVVPTTLSYTYVSTLPELREKPRPPAQVAQLYRLVVSQVVLLYMRDLFEADAELENVELGGHVHSINPATGQREYPCLISVAVDRDAYTGLNLRDVRPDVCLRHLNAVISHHPDQVEGSPRCGTSIWPATPSSRVSTWSPGLIPAPT